MIVMETPVHRRHLETAGEVERMLKGQTFPLSRTARVDLVLISGTDPQIILLFSQSG